MTDRFFACLKVVAGDRTRAPQMRIVNVEAVLQLLRLGKGDGRGETIGKAFGPRGLLPSSKTEIHSSGNTPLHIVGTLACATQSEDCLRFVAESSLPARDRRYGQ